MRKRELHITKSEMDSAANHRPLVHARFALCWMPPWTLLKGMRPWHFRPCCVAGNVRCEMLSMEAAVHAGSGEIGASQAQAHVVAIVLAAGRSTRMGAQNKLLADIGGKPMVRHVVETALASKARPVLVVTGHMAAEIGGALAGLEVTLVPNPGYATGLASSLKAGLRAVPAECDGALILLGDMPSITAAHVDRLVDAFAAAPDAIVVPVHEGRQGNPLLWPRRYLPQLLQLDGDTGAKRLIAAHQHDVREVDLQTSGIFADIDTPDELARTRQG
jgi:molybdenum cofactor cytidylyltransferase